MVKIIFKRWSTSTILLRKVDCVKFKTCCKWNKTPKYKILENNTRQFIQFGIMYRIHHTSSNIQSVYLFCYVRDHLSIKYAVQLKIHMFMPSIGL